MNVIYEDDLSTVIRGSSYTVLPLLHEMYGIIDLILTDPPYAIDSVSRSSGKTGNHGVARARTYKPVIGDTSNEPLRLAWMRRHTERLIAWGADHAVDLSEFPGARWLVWDKRDGLRSNNFADAELAIDTGGGAARLFRHRQMGMLGDGLGWKRVHPNQKPVSLMRWVLDNVTPKPGLVVDPFAGVGTTMVACAERGIPCIGIELDPDYCNIAVDRLRQRPLVEAPGRRLVGEQLQGWTA